jgi:hypothetical protein
MMPGDVMREKRLLKFLITCQFHARLGREEILELSKDEIFYQASSILSPVKLTTQ